MAEIASFQKKLEEITTLAKLNGRRIGREGVAHFFREEGLSEEQLEKVCEYLRLQGLRVLGEKKEEEPEARQKEAAKTPLTPEEEEYLRSYEASLLAEEGLLAACMREALPLAREFHVEGSFIGDLLQEGSMSLLAAMEEQELTREGAMEAVRLGMAQAAAAVSQQKYEDEFLVEKVRHLEQAIRELDEEVGAKSSIEELSAYLDMEVEEIRAVLSLTGEE